VTVTKFVMKDTIEERMIKLQSAKKSAKGSSTMEAQATAGSIHDDKVNLKLDEFDELFGIDGSLYPRSENDATDDMPEVKRKGNVRTKVVKRSKTSKSKHNCGLMMRGEDSDEE
jgi:hypothetical protein